MPEAHRGKLLGLVLTGAGAEPRGPATESLGHHITERGSRTWLTSLMCEEEAETDPEASFLTLPPFLSYSLPERQHANER